jgi:hypothetical protein
VAAFAPGADFGKRGGIVALLRRDKAIEVVHCGASLGVGLALCYSAVCGGVTVSKSMRTRPSSMSL